MARTIHLSRTRGTYSECGLDCPSDKSRTAGINFVTCEACSDAHNARCQLLEWLKPGDTVYTTINHVSRSGMQRSISLFIPATLPDGRLEIVKLDYWASRLLGWKLDDTNGGLKIGGCGMDMAFHAVYSLGGRMWPDGTATPHGMRNREPDSTGGYALKKVSL